MNCFWPRCSDHKRCEAFGSCVAKAQAGGKSWPEPNGISNLRAILDDQPYLNSVLSVIEIRTVLENEGGFMPDEAVMWFREWRAVRS